MPLPVQWKMLCPGELQKHLMPNNQGHLLKCTGTKCEFTCKGSVRRLIFNQNLGTPVGLVQNSIITFNNSTPVGRGFPVPQPNIVVINDGVPTPFGSTVAKGLLVAGLPPWTIADGFVVLNTGLEALDFTPVTPYFRPVVITGITGAVASMAVTQPAAAVPPGGFVGIPVSLSGTGLGPFSADFTVYTDDSDQGEFAFSWTGTII